YLAARRSGIAGGAAATVTRAGWVSSWRSKSETTSVRRVGKICTATGMNSIRGPARVPKARSEFPGKRTPPRGDRQSERRAHHRDHRPLRRHHRLSPDERPRRSHPQPRLERRDHRRERGVEPRGQVASPLPRALFTEPIAAGGPTGLEVIGTSPGQCDCCDAWIAPRCARPEDCYRCCPDCSAPCGRYKVEPLFGDSKPCPVCSPLPSATTTTLH